MPATATLTGLDFIILPTADLARSEAWYHDVLGLEIDSKWGEMAVEFKLEGATTLAMVDPKAIGREFAAVKTGTVAFRVADFEAASAALKAKGVEFHGEVIDSGVCKMWPFSDPDGNSLMLHHRYA